MKRFGLISLTVLAALFVTTLCVERVLSEPYKLGVKEYDDFHHVLHPLEHESLPKKDFESIRTKANELVSLGHQIVQLGVPKGTSTENVEAFTQELERFSKALKKFGSDAREGKDEELKVSFSALHDSFEMLAGMLPRDS